MKSILDAFNSFCDYCYGYPNQPKGMVFVRRYNERMINFGMGKTFWEIWFCPKTNRNHHRFIIV